MRVEPPALAVSDAAPVQAGRPDGQARADRARRLGRLGELGAPARPRFRTAVGYQAAAGWLVVAQAGCIALVAQRVFADRVDPRALVGAFAGLLLVGVLRALLAWRGQRAAAAYAEAVKLGWRRQSYAALQALGPVRLRSARAGELSETLLGHADALDGYYGGYLLARMELALVPPVIVAAVLYADWIVGLVLLLTAPLIPFFMMLVGWGAEEAGRRQLRALARLGGHFADRLRGLGLIQAYGQAAAEIAGIAAASESLRVRTVKVLRVAFLSSAVLEFFASASIAVIALYLGLEYLGLVHLRTGGLPLWVGVFCLLLAPEFFAPLRRLAAHYHDRANALAAVAEFERLVAAMDPQRDDAGPAERADVRSAPGVPGAPVDPDIIIDARGVSLRHPGASTPASQPIDLRLRRGDRVALVGASGSGKSTLLEALAGWRTADGGALWMATGLRIAHASQRPTLFHGSLLDNLRMAAPGASAAELLQAAEQAQVMAFVRPLPDGLETRVGERGFGLSGGEARRLALARIFLGVPDLVLLDEPTAFLDPGTEARVLDALSDFAQGRTVVIATHSPAVIAWATTVVRIRAGEGPRDGAAPGAVA